MTSGVARDEYLHGRALALEVVRLLDTAPWTEGYRDDTVTVSSSDGLGAPVVGYRTVTEPAAPIETLAAFLGPGLIDAFSKLNARFAFGETLVASPWVVRTGFSMPTGFAPREFVHSMACEWLGADVHVIAYGPVDESALPKPRAGYIRCPIWPSGQRLTRLGPNATRVEHLMTYALDGSVPRWAQNRFFHRGHLGAYRDEWTRLVRHMAAAGATAGVSP